MREGNSDNMRWAPSHNTIKKNSTTNFTNSLPKKKFHLISI